MSISNVTPWSSLLDDGVYELSFQQEPVLAGVHYRFQAWSDGAPIIISAGNVLRTINLNNTLTIGATFTEVIITANVTFTGKASAQAASGETVTVVVTKPDTTKENLTGTTDSTGAFTATKQYTVVGSYSAQSSIAADAQYSAAISAVVPFTISLSTRTLTLSVTVA